MAICIETFEQSNGLRARFETSVYRTAEVRTGKNDARSEPGDLDLVTHSLRKYLQLALKGNPSVLVPLYLTDPFLQVCTVEGYELQALAPRIISKRAIVAFLGYLTAQEEKLKGERSTRVHRPELVAKYGYDTKFAMHALRLGFQGLELAQEHRLTLPMTGSVRLYLRDVRTGKYPLVEVLASIERIKEALRAELQESELPDEPDTEAVERWMLEKYRERWVEL
jgi:predicted nucleotidyltransferase